MAGSGWHWRKFGSAAVFRHRLQGGQRTGPGQQTQGRQHHARPESEGEGGPGAGVQLPAADRAEHLGQ